MQLSNSLTTREELLLLLLLGGLIHKLFLNLDEKVRSKEYVLEEWRLARMIQPGSNKEHSVAQNGKSVMLLPIPE